MGACGYAVKCVVRLEDANLRRVLGVPLERSAVQQDLRSGDLRGRPVAPFVAGIERSQSQQISMQHYNVCFDDDASLARGNSLISQDRLIQTVSAVPIVDDCATELLGQTPRPGFPSPTSPLKVMVDEARRTFERLLDRNGLRLSWSGQPSGLKSQGAVNSATDEERTKVRNYSRCPARFRGQ